MSSGDARAYVGQADVTLMYSVVNVADINHVSRMVFANASAAIAAMSKSTKKLESSATQLTTNRSLA